MCIAGSTMPKTIGSYANYSPFDGEKYVVLPLEVWLQKTEPGDGGATMTKEHTFEEPAVLDQLLVAVRGNGAVVACKPERA